MPLHDLLFSYQTQRSPIESLRLCGFLISTIINLQFADVVAAAKPLSIPTAQ